MPKHTDSPHPFPTSDRRSTRSNPVRTFAVVDADSGPYPNAFKRDLVLEQPGGTYVLKNRGFVQQTIPVPGTGRNHARAMQFADLMRKQSLDRWEDAVKGQSMGPQFAPPPLTIVDSPCCGAVASALVSRATPTGWFPRQPESVGRPPFCSPAPERQPVAKPATPPPPPAPVPVLDMEGVGHRALMLQDAMMRGCLDIIRASSSPAPTPRDADGPSRSQSRPRDDKPLTDAN